jgi:cytochrome c2
MWPAMEAAGIPKPSLSERDAADLFAYFYAFRFFDLPGDAARGAQAFKDRMCAECHSLSSPGPEGAPPVRQWTSLGDSTTLAAAMWNHAPRMREVMARRKVNWPLLSSQIYRDMLLYLRTAPGVKPGAPQFSLGTAEEGSGLFASKGCRGCHTGGLELEGRVRGRTPSDFAASMWNHANKMEPVPMAAAEMRNLNAYLWSIQYFETAGNARRGRAAWISKGCATCHDDASSGAPKLQGATINNVVIVSALWRHGPAMQAAMKKRGLRWPTFYNEQLSDLITYVQSRR